MVDGTFLDAADQADDRASTRVDIVDGVAPGVAVSVRLAQVGGLIQRIELRPAADLRIVVALPKVVELASPASIRKRAMSRSARRLLARPAGVADSGLRR